MNPTPSSHQAQGPSPWIQRWAHLIPAGTAVLDVACGFGRHMKWLQHQGHTATGVDKSQEAIDAASQWGRSVLADIEAGPWPFAGQAFGAVVVTHYLWRQRLPDIVAAVAPGGVLLYETFAAGNETVGKPSRADFLLQPGELLGACAGLRIVAYEDGFLPAPERFVQRIAAVRLSGGAPRVPRHELVE